MSNQITLDDVFSLTLTSSVSYADPFRDVALYAVFTAPDGAQTEIPAQHRSHAWMVKFCPPSIGQWTYKTVCSSSADTGLHEVSGEFLVAAAHERKVFSVDSFGACPGSTQNATEAFRAAIAAASAYTEETGLYAEVALSKEAEYRLSIDYGFDGDATVLIKLAKNITFNGNGSTLVFTNTEHAGVVVENSENINLLNFHVNFDPLPYTQGRITAMDKEKSTIDYEIMDGYIDLDDAVFQTARDCYGITRVLDGGTYKYGPTAVMFSQKERLDGKKWRCTVGGGFYADQMKKLHVGDDFVYKAHNYSCMVGIEYSHNVRAEGIHIHAAPGLCFFPLCSECVVIRDCHVYPLNHDHFVSTNADGIHARSNRGFLMFDGCSFEAMSDDGINIHSSALPVREVKNPSCVVVLKHTYTVQPGDRLAVMDRAQGTVRAEVYVTAVEEQEYTYVVSFDREVPGIRAGEGFSDADNLYNLNSCGTSFVIRNCHFKSHRCRDVLLSTQYGIVENNIFENEDGWGVALFHETLAWGEGPIVRDVQIRNNVFHGRSRARQAAIFSYITVKEGVLPSREVKNITVTGNRFYDIGRVMDFDALSGGLIADNMVENKPGTQQRYGDYNSIVLNNCDHVTVSRYKLTDENENLQAVYRVTDSCAEPITLDAPDAQVLPQVQTVLDER